MPVSISGIRSSNTLQVSIGGTGNNTLASGSLLVGNGNGPIATIAAGAEGQILGVVNGEWTAIDNSGGGGGGGGGGLSSITTSGNLQGSGTAGSPATLKANISLTSVTASFKGDGSQITGITAAQVSGIISSVSASGNIEGNGTSGSAITLKDNISLNSVSASFSGDGSNISGLSAAQLSDFDSSVDARITNIPNAALQNSSITVNGQAVSLGGTVTIATVDENPVFTSVTAATGAISGDLTVQGNLFVNGAQTVVNTSDLTITDNVILIASGAVNAAQLDGAGIHFGRLPSEDARIIYDSVNDWMEIYPGISSSTIRGTFVGDGSGLTGVADSSVINFTGSGFAVGNIVALSGTYVKADYSDTLKSNAIGAVSAVDGTSVTIKVFGEVTATSASLAWGVGIPVYVGPSGSVVQYSSIPSGKFATQVGFISPTSGKIMLQPRVFGQLA